MSLSSEDVEALVQADYGDKVRPVNGAKLQKQQRQLQHMAALQDKFKAGNAENEIGTVDELENNEEP